MPTLTALFWVVFTVKLRRAPWTVTPYYRAEHIAHAQVERGALPAQGAATGYAIAGAEPRVTRRRALCITGFRKGDGAP